VAPMQRQDGHCTLTGCGYLTWCRIRRNDAPHSSEAASMMPLSALRHECARAAVTLNGAQWPCLGGRRMVTGAFVQGVARPPVSVPAQAVGNVDAVTEVATPQELQQAVMQGARHIEVTAHMDLTSLDAALHPGGILLGVVSDTTRSIRVCLHVSRPAVPLCHAMPNACPSCTCPAHPDRLLLQHN